MTHSQRAQAATAYAVVDVGEWNVLRSEASGVEEKRWLEDENGAAWLYKGVTQHEDDGKRWHQREHASERISTEIAKMLSVPCAHAELAIAGDRIGTISRDVKLDRWELQPGSVLLTERDPAFVAKTKERTGHSLDAIRGALLEVQPPPGAELPDSFDAFDAFVGFLMLDALIANQDRHEENWAVLLPPAPSDDRYLSPSFDHGSSLGYNVLSPRIQANLSSEWLQRWASRGKARRFEVPSGEDGPPDLVTFAHRGLAMAHGHARDHWLSRLTSLSPGQMDEAVDRMPSLSQAAASFCKELLAVNRRRILNAR